ncbi:hypothetical protein [Aestuariispira insulae]|uniref:Uncharacterized protein n=1 Tax=Aestuariispira insulae TaxID=1461337 RepID=A0A3D9H450_9PROT|nr:hypothetical protein [Aestuariispira insulae]RED43706.1 hypothetical protein DFP90_12117 [Aestuariispira insulae]
MSEIDQDIQKIAAPGRSNTPGSHIPTELERRIIDFISTPEPTQKLPSGNITKVILREMLDLLENHPASSSAEMSAAMNLIHAEIRNADILEQTKGLVVKA